MSKKVIALVSGVLILTTVFVGLMVYGLWTFFTESTLSNNPSKVELTKFKSESDFQAYLNQVTSNSQTRDDFATPENTNSKDSSGDAATSSPDRVSETNVQVAGIDEADIIKTDGRNIYYSPPSKYVIYDLARPTTTIYPGPSYPKQSTRIISAYPADELDLKDEIDKSGTLYHSKKDNTLIILNSEGIFAYNLGSSLEKPSWDLKTESDVSILETRYFNDMLYIITVKYIHDDTPCLIPLLGRSSSETTFDVECSSIYYAPDYYDNNGLISIFKVNPKDGAILKSTSIVGKPYGNIVYMSENNLYVTYSKDMTEPQIRLELLKSVSSLLPESVNKEITRIMSYDISDQSKEIEIELILTEYNNSLTEEQSADLQSKTFARIADFTAKNQREMYKTGIARVTADSLEVKATGSVPGRPLNQFSIDEYDGNLRIATSVPRPSSSVVSNTGVAATNDLYILSRNLKIIGDVKDFGIDERIYSTRFVGNRAYVVTFKQIDPFFVFDLSDPEDPQKLGELKIPGFSSYLHVLPNGNVLGIGQEGFDNVKMTLFDVSNESTPKELSTYIIPNSWSEISNNHHAFLIDTKHQVFFLPSGDKSYIMSYSGNTLTTKKVLDDTIDARAVYIDNVMYIVSESTVKAYNESSWEEISSLTFENLLKEDPLIPAVPEKLEVPVGL